MMSEDPNFFEPIHLSHLIDGRYHWLKFLGLAPGWRFLWTPDCEDVWFDPKLLAA